MSDHDWTTDDLALCIDDSPCRCHDIRHPCLKMGKVYRVRYALMLPDDDFVSLALHGVEGVHNHDHIAAYRFRKLRPADPDFIEQLRVANSREVAELV